MGAKHSSSSELTLVSPLEGTDSEFSKEGAPTLQGKGDANIQCLPSPKKKMLHEVENIVVYSERRGPPTKFPKTS